MGNSEINKNSGQVSENGLREKYYRTDLACESISASKSTEEKAGSTLGVEYKEKKRGKTTVSELCISTDEGAEITGRKKGRYITISCGKIWLWSDEKIDETSLIIAEELKSAAENLTKKKIDSGFSVLICGLGNPKITSDAVGCETVDRINVTRHIKKANKKLFDMMGSCIISALKPGVMGQTGIETADIIKGVIEKLRPDLVIAIDALAARSCDRLASTVQISDSGISPGSGIGNNRNAITAEYLGVPVIGLGVPTVVESSALVYDALEKAGIENPDENLRNVLENGRSFFVSLKESDIIINDTSRLLASSITRAFSV